MCVVVYVRERSGDDPGHMVVGQEPVGSNASYYGFRFDPADLPPEFQPQDQWRNYLFDHPVPGYIDDETEKTRYLILEKARLYSKRASCEAAIASVLPAQEKWRPHARYSFNPDTHHTPADPCYNCVTWAILIANALAPAMLVKVNQGRVKHIIKQLEPPPAEGK
ncbi:MAG: hypothetical protein U0871_07505 [Gemmataceae bacterium]